MPGTPTYFPAIRPKLGELTALQHVPVASRPGVVPIVDLEWDESIAGRSSTKLTGQLVNAWGTHPLIVDAAAADEVEGGVSAFEDLLKLLREADASAIPTVGLASSSDLLSAASTAHGLDGNGVCIRLQAEDLGAGAQLGAWITDLLAELEVAAADIDLVIDLGAIDENSIGLHSALLGLALPGVPAIDDWRHITVLSGAFPATLDIGTKRIVPIPRADADLWRQVRANGAVARTLDYGDYGVTHPRMAVGGPFRSAPNVRYTHDDDWKAMKWTLRAEEGHSGLYEIARIMRDAGILDAPTFSWGDAELHSRADRNGGPGAGAQWKAWSTSHHIAKVSSRLSTLGEP